MGSSYLFTPVGSGGGSSSASSGTGKNYLGTVNGVNLNGDFELGLTTGWGLGTVTLTNALPTGVPTFGSGASGNLSISAVTSGKLAGSYSLSYVSSAATTAGNMLHSDAFTIDLEDQAKVMTFKLYYSPTVNPGNANWSGTASNSFSVAIYDVTNSAWIIPAGVRSLTQSSGVGIATGTFQTPSNGSQFRLVVFNSVATSGAITVLFDDFSLGPQTTSIGPVVTDWESYTPTGAWTANSPTYTGKWRRVGDSMEVQAKVAMTGAPDAANLTINLPSGHTIDTAKLVETTANLEAIGTGSVNDSGSTFYKAFVAYSSTTAVMVRYQNNASGASATVSNTTPLTFGSGDSVNVMFKVPITGWSSNVQMSNDTDTRVVAAQVRLASSTAFNTAPIKFDTVISDSHSAYSVSTGQFTCPVSGYYRVSATLSGNATYTPLVKKNGTAYASFSTVTATTVTTGSTTVKCNAGDTLTVETNGSVTVTGDAGAPSQSMASFERLSGPAVVAASESVNARYTTTNAQSILTTATDVITTMTKVYDSHNAWNATTGVYTVPVSGKFRISGNIESTSTARTVGSGRFALLSISGTATISGPLFPIWASITTYVGCGVNTTKDYNAGDTISFSLVNQTGSTIVLDGTAGGNYFTIERVGN